MKNQSQLQSVDNKYCLDKQSECRVKTAIGEFDVAFSVQTVRPDEPFRLIVTNISGENVTGISGYVEGKDMFMGKIPVLFESAGDQSQAEMILVACHENVMTWRLWLTIESTEQSKNKTTFFVDFEAIERD